MPTQANENVIIPAIECETWRNSRHIGRELGLSQPRVLEILHDAELLPHHYSRSAHLFPDDRPYVCNFADGYINTLPMNELVLRKILWTDKAFFTCEGVLIIHKSHLWTRRA
jgi:hypothetical protein